MPQALGEEVVWCFEGQEGCWRWVVMAVTVSTVLGPRWMASNGHTRLQLGSNQIRPDQIRSPRLPVEITTGGQRGGVAQSLPRNLPYVSELVLGSSEGGSQTSWRGDGSVGRYGREADARMARGKDEQSRAEQNRRETRWAREKQNPPRLDNTPPANLDYPNCTVCRSVCE